MPDAESKAQGTSTLTSWKEIAQFFNREVRTVQRWEKEEGLPVHRHLHHQRSSVYAYPAELEAWWRDGGSGRLSASSTAEKSLASAGRSKP